MGSRTLTTTIYIVIGFFVCFAVFVGGRKLYISHRNFLISDQELTDKRSVIDPSMKVEYLTSGYTNLRYATLGPEDAQPLILIHGAPGSLFTWNSLISDTSITKNYRLYIIDRPGYGKSTTDHTFNSFQEQSDFIGMLFDADIITRTDAIFVGYSFGGSLLPYLMLEYSDRIAGTLFVGGSTDPEHQTIRWVNHLSRFSLFHLLMPDSLNHTNDESLASEEQLKLIEDSWSDIKIPSVILHSFDDRIVPYANAVYTEEHLTNAPHIVMHDDGVDHFYPYAAPDRIVEALEKLKSLTEQTG